MNWPGGQGWQKAWPGAGLKKPGRQGVLQGGKGCHVLADVRPPLDVAESLVVYGTVTLFPLSGHT